MTIVNFAIPKILDKRIGHTIKEKGFASKAEFFRFAALYFMDMAEKKAVNEDAKLNYLVSEIAREVTTNYRGKKLPSIEEQLANL